ncbi:hypothetical protein F511_21347 [Dorcoceras hygrometricum]|uniref:Uncharacterized protein n=1 Tax=Dorcoceras hygrometricum TaxID=472368 RepID=A0A2Z7CN35_9LAMI|nr:hypothetical protein F511_21347 [Dorcoceras hygrometricum]
MAASGHGSKLIGDASRIGILYRSNKRSWYLWMSSVMLHHYFYIQICFSRLKSVSYPSTVPIQGDGTADEGVSFLVVDRIGDIYRNLQRRADVIVTTVGARHKCQQGCFADCGVASRATRDFCDFCRYFSTLLAGVLVRVIY